MMLDDDENDDDDNNVQWMMILFNGQLNDADMKYDYYLCSI